TWNCYLAPAGWLYMLAQILIDYANGWLGGEQDADARIAGKTFLVAYGIVGYYFCNKMEGGA
ncbi:hypothetical protein T492DRAFT_892933, partial [Pavlovales sp. CCMP2436]